MMPTTLPSTPAVSARDLSPRRASITKPHAEDLFQTAIDNPQCQDFFESKRVYLATSNLKWLQNAVIPGKQKLQLFLCFLENTIYENSGVSNAERIPTLIASLEPQKGYQNLLNTIKEAVQNNPELQEMNADLAQISSDSFVRKMDQYLHMEVPLAFIIAGAIVSLILAKLSLVGFSIPLIFLPFILGTGVGVIVCPMASMAIRYAFTYSIPQDKTYTHDANIWGNFIQDPTTQQESGTKYVASLEYQTEQLNKIFAKKEKFTLEKGYLSDEKLDEFKAFVAETAAIIICRELFQAFIAREAANQR